MSKKVSFKRPKRPDPSEADAWVKAEAAERPAPTADQTGEPSPPAAAIPSPPPAQATARPSVEQQSLINELRWCRQIMGGLARQVELMPDRVERSGLDGRLTAQPTSEQQELQNDIADKLARVTERLNALRKALDGR